MWKRFSSNIVFYQTFKEKLKKTNLVHQDHRSGHKPPKEKIECQSTSVWWQKNFFLQDQKPSSTDRWIRRNIPFLQGSFQRDEVLRYKRESTRNSQETKKEKKVDIKKKERKKERKIQKETEEEEEEEEEEDVRWSFLHLLKGCYIWA